MSTFPRLLPDCILPRQQAEPRSQAQPFETDVGSPVKGRARLRIQIQHSLQTGSPRTSSKKELFKPQGLNTWLVCLSGKSCLQISDGRKVGKHLFTFEGSPPKAAILSFTHWMAKRWSSRPAFPRTFSLSGRERKPRGPSLSKKQANKQTRVNDETHKNIMTLKAQCSSAHIFKIKVPSSVNLLTCSSLILQQHPHSRPSNGRH